MRTKTKKKTKMRRDWVCYLCEAGWPTKIKKFKVQITRTTKECAFICVDCLPRKGELIQAMRDLLAFPAHILRDKN